MPGTVQPHPPRLREYVIKLGAGARLPLQARSLTTAEMTAQDRLLARVMLGLYVGLGALLLVGTASDPADPQTTAILAAVFLAGLVPVWIGSNRFARRRGAHVDPQQVIEVRDSWLTIRHPGGAFDIRYGEADLAFNWTTFRNMPNYRGIFLQTPIGTLKVDDEHYRDGRFAAAAIVARCDAAGLFAGLER